MPKLVRAVPVGGVQQEAEVTLTAETDFDAILQAKRALGEGTHFDLWDGSRRVLTYRPMTGRAAVGDGVADCGYLLVLAAN